MQRGGWGNDGVLKSVYRHAMEDQSATMNQKVNNHLRIYATLNATRYKKVPQTRHF